MRGGSGVGGVALALALSRREEAVGLEDVVVSGGSGLNVVDRRLERRHVVEWRDAALGRGGGRLKTERESTAENEWSTRIHKQFEMTHEHMPESCLGDIFYPSLHMIERLDVCRKCWVVVGGHFNRRASEDFNRSASKVRDIETDATDSGSR